jgi:DNA-binding MarR family transcriptional regulator/RimJ/RimL family protein N-acetyltransferase
VEDATDDQIATLRRFNRSYTQRIGALQESFLGSGRPLGLARLLFEIGPDGATVLDLRTRLGLDSGYVSRLLRQLEADGSISVAPDPQDGRRRVVTLTDRGRQEWADLDARSDDLARELLTPLNGRQRAELQELLAGADRLIRVATLTFDVVDPRHPLAVASLRTYFAELDRRFPTGFDPGDAITADAAGFEPPDGVFLLARNDGDAVACGGLTRHDPTTAEVKRMWVDPGWRRYGLGRRMLAALEQWARERGYRRVVLDTNSTLTEAISMYERANYRSIERYNDNPYARHWFEKSIAAANAAETNAS